MRKTRGNDEEKVKQRGRIRNTRKKTRIYCEQMHLCGMRPAHETKPCYDYIMMINDYKYK